MFKTEMARMIVMSQPPPPKEETEDPRTFLKARKRSLLPKGRIYSKPHIFLYVMSSNTKIVSQGFIMKTSTKTTLKKKINKKSDLV